MLSVTYYAQNYVGIIGWSQMLRQVNIRVYVGMFEMQSCDGGYQRLHFVSRC